MKKTIVSMIAMGFLAAPVYAQDAFEKFEKYENSVAMTCWYKKEYQDGYTRLSYRYDGETLYINDEPLSPETDENTKVKKKEGERVFIVNQYAVLHEMHIEYFIDFENTRSSLRHRETISDGNCTRQ